MKIKMSPITTTIFSISGKAAHFLLRANDSKPPKFGYETLILYNGKYYWISRFKNIHWEIRETSWKLINGKAVLGGNLL